VAQDEDQCQSVVSTVMNICVPYKLKPFKVAERLLASAKRLLFKEISS
jgi:hypothetical protein